MPDLFTLLAVVIAAVFAFVLAVSMIVLLKQNYSLRRSTLQIAKEQHEIAYREFSVKFEEWKADYEEDIRKDAIQRSQSSITGNVSQHFVPFQTDFPYNPKDARFFGAPIDYVIFDGLDEGELKRVVFLEVKTGKCANLSTRQRQIRDVIRYKKVEWKEYRINRDDVEEEVEEVEEVETAIQQSQLNIFGINFERD